MSPPDWFNVRDHLSARHPYEPPEALRDLHQVLQSLRDEGHPSVAALDSVAARLDGIARLAWQGNALLQEFERLQSEIAQSQSS